MSYRDFTLQDVKHRLGVRLIEDEAILIAPLLLEVQRMFGNRYGFFSGREFNVDPARGLVGVCDFLLSLSPERYEIEAPLVAVLGVFRQIVRHAQQSSGEAQPLCPDGAR